MRESSFQQHIIGRLRVMLPNCVIIKNDPQYLQGIPDLLVLFKDRWGMLEIKASATSYKGPNQDYYVDLFDSMSFAAFIFPENEEEVLSDLQHALSD